MDTRPNLLLVVSAILYLAGALPLLFAPDEILAFAGGPPSALTAALLQVVGSALFGFAMLNWLSRHSRVGGIFGRPLLVANLAHTASAALLLAHVASRVPVKAPLAVALAFYAVLVVSFGLRLFALPSLKSGPGPESPSEQPTVKYWRERRGA